MDNNIKSIQQVFTRILPGKAKEKQQKVNFEQKKDEFVKNGPDKKTLDALKKEFLGNDFVESMQSLIDNYYWHKGKYSIGFNYANTAEKEIVGITIGIRDWDLEEVDVKEISAKDFWDIVSEAKDKQIKEHPETKDNIAKLYDQLSQKFKKVDNEKES